MIKQNLITPIHIFFLFLFSILVWGKSAFFDFVWDDTYYIVLNEALRSPSYILDYFYKDTVQQAIPPYVYRPLRTLHYGALVWLQGGNLNPLVFHISNILWHIGVGTVFYFLIQKLLSITHGGLTNQIKWISFFAATSFLIHPVVSEVVCWAKSLDDLMATFFILLSFLFSLKAWESEKEGNNRLLLFSSLFLALSLFSKVSTVGLVALYTFILFLFKNINKKKFIIWMAVNLLIAFLYLAIRHFVLGASAQIQIPLSGSYSQTLIDMIPMITLYIRVMLGIGPFLPDYDFLTGNYPIISLDVFIGITIVLLLFFAIVFALRKPKQNLLIWFGLLWLFLSLLPVMNIIPMMQYFAERFSYTPLVGWLLFVSGIFSQIVKKSNSKMYMILVGIVILSWSTISYAQSSKWKNEYSLMEYSYYNAPSKSYRIIINYLTALDRSKNYELLDSVLDHHRNTISEKPKGKWIVARRMYQKGSKKEAIKEMSYLKKDLEGNLEYLMDLGSMYAGQNRMNQAGKYFERVTRSWPVYARGWEMLGRTQIDSGKNREGLVNLYRAVQLGPKNIRAWKKISVTAWKVEDWDLAKEAFGKLATLEPENPEYVYWLNKLSDRST